MSLELYAAFLVACLVIIIVPGPTVTLVIANSLRHGRRAGLLNVAGPFKHGGGPQLASNAASGPVLASATSVDNSGVATDPKTIAQSKAAADQLAPYLAAHRQSGMSGPFQMPGSDIRNASLVQPAQ